MSEQPREGTRIEVLHPDSTYGRARNRMERESIPTGMEPAQPQPREGTRVEGCQHDSTRVDGWLDDCCLRCGASGYFKDGHYVDPTGKQTKGHPSGKTLIWPEPAQPERPRGEEARAYERELDRINAELRRGVPIDDLLGPAPPRGEGDDLAARLDERAELWERKGGLGANIAAGAYREAAAMARASTHPEQSERIVGAALDLLDSLGAPHYHDLIGMTYTLRKEQADNLRAALEPASPTPTEEENR